MEYFCQVGFVYKNNLNGAILNLENFKQCKTIRIYKIQLFDFMIVLKNFTY